VSPRFLTILSPFSWFLMLFLSLEYSLSFVPLTLLPHRIAWRKLPICYLEVGVTILFSSAVAPFSIPTSSLINTGYSLGFVFVSSLLFVCLFVC
jgi:hypothetical protein